MPVRDAASRTERWICYHKRGCGKPAFYLLDEPMDGITIVYAGNMLRLDGGNFVNGEFIVCGSCAQRMGTLLASDFEKECIGKPSRQRESQMTKRKPKPITLGIEGEVKQPEYSKWECDFAGMAWRPLKGREPNAIHRFFQRLILGAEWTQK